MNDRNGARPRLSIPPSETPHKPRDRTGMAERLYGPKPSQAPAVVPTAAKSPEPTTWTRFKVNRDHEVPLEFDGIVLGKVEQRGQSPVTAGCAAITRAALYETRGGKFITEFTRYEEEPLIPNPRAPRPVIFGKAAVFDSRDVALMWFRKGGRFTLSLLEQLGELPSEFIE